MDRRKFVTGALGPGIAGALGASAAVPQASPARRVARKRRVLFWAVDAMDPAIVARFQDRLPNIQRMMREGYSGRILPYVSCWGNMDFMSMMTGAPPGTQYRSRTQSGSPPAHQACVSETIWQALESEGRRSFLLEFPGARADRLTAVIPGGASPVVGRGAIYQTGNVVIQGLYSGKIEATGWPPGGGPRPGRKPTVISDPKPATGWQAPPASRLPAIETALGVWPVLLVSSGNAGYDTMIVYKEKNGPEIVRLRPGVWSGWARVAVRGNEGVVRFQLLELAPDGKRLQVLQSAICASGGFSEPGDLAGKLVERLGPFWTGSAIPPSASDPFRQAGAAEALESALWAANAASHAAELWDWDFFLHKPSLVDSAMHECLTLADPSYHGYDPAVAKAYDAAYAEAYIDLDKTVGKLIEVADRLGDTVVVVASDHGGGVNNTVCDIDKRLREAGLEGRAYTKRTRQGTEVFVNLKGREPNGTVALSDYERVQEAVIDALLDWRDPVGKKRAIAYALKLRDAALIGYWGDEAGDVQFCYNPGFVWGVNPDGLAIAPSRSPVANHGPQIVTASTGYSSMMGQLLAWGPGVTRGVKRDEKALGPVPIASVAPTLSALLGCRTPRDCQLGPIREMLAP
jgi:hypothetical protein